ncbi:hypothetical protein ABFS83_04G179500 [Erythranthe nasuta]
MAAYSAVVSLLHILHPDQFPLIYDRTPEIESLYSKLVSLQSLLEKIVPTKSIRDEVNNLDVQIREAIYTAQDKIESFIFRQEQIQTALLPEIIIIAADTIDPLITKAEAIACSISETSSPENMTRETRSTNIFIKKIVGQEEDLKKLKDEILNDTCELAVVPIVGLPGIGKTTLARSIYNHRHIKKHFNIRAWVTVTQDYQLKEIYSDLLSSIERKGEKSRRDRVTNTEASASKLADRLHKELQGGRYLVVVDDVWDEESWDALRHSFPDLSNNSRIVVTSRLREIAHYVVTSRFEEEIDPRDTFGYFIHAMKPLDDENSWTLLRQTVFRDDDRRSCPPHLLDIGLKIARNCRGLPLSLTVVGGLLFAQGNESGGYWESIEEDTHAAAARGDESYLEILYLSYNHLPGRLKPCFLYMGAFPEDSEILVSKLVSLWVAEGFLEPAQQQSVEEVAAESLEQLIDRNLLHIRSYTSNNRTKACGMHDSLRDLSVKECGNEKFFHSRRKYVQELPEDTDAQRRICVHRNVLMCMEEVHDSVKRITFARTLLYAGPHHHHPLPFCLTFDLLRVLDALTVCFIEFSDEIVKLVHLRYLSLTYNGKLPSTLCNLRKLQILMVRRHPKIIYMATSFLPIEIWNMAHLRHLVFTESDLPGIIHRRHDEEDSVLFANLQSLSNVSAASCTKEVLQNMPNLKKLAVWTKTPPGPADSCLHLGQLKNLQTFKFTVVQPRPKLVSKTKIIDRFPNTLVKLRLSGCALPWEDMAVIGQLPCLEVLKLRDMAFKGDRWHVGADEFGMLKFLLFEYMDLKVWELADDGGGNSHFPKLERLILRYCYLLGDIPGSIRYVGGLELVELVECSVACVDSALEISEYAEKNGNENLKVRIYSSWE